MTSTSRFLVILLILVSAASFETRGELEDDHTGTSKKPQDECAMDDEGQCQIIEQQKQKSDPEGRTVGYDYDDNPLWKSGDRHSIVNHLGCNWESKEGYGEETWRTFNRVYNEAVNPEQSSIPPTYEKNGFQIPIEIKYVDEVGRGVFTKVDINKGDLVYISTNNAQFRTAQEYRNFLQGLPRDLACDVIIWAFCRMLSEEREDEFLVCVDLDEGSFVNSAPRRRFPFKVNIELGTGYGLLEKGVDDERVTWYGCDLKFYANRNIHANEEIRADYGDFAEPHGWPALGL